MTASWSTSAIPRAHEDDPRRAVQAGLEIVEAVQALNAERRRRGVDIAVRIGINTGLVVAGDIGTGEFRDEMAVVGETPNVAARLQELAEPAPVVVGESTRRLVEGLFVFDELGPRTVKGIDRPITVYRAREASGAPAASRPRRSGASRPWSAVTKSSTCCCRAGPTPWPAKGRSCC